MYFRGRHSSRYGMAAPTERKENGRRLRDHKIHCSAICLGFLANFQLSLLRTALQTGYWHAMRQPCLVALLDSRLRLMNRSCIVTWMILKCLKLWYAMASRILNCFKNETLRTVIRFVWGDTLTFLVKLRPEPVSAGEPIWVILELSSERQAFIGQPFFQPRLSPIRAVQGCGKVPQTQVRVGLLQVNSLVSTWNQPNNDCYSVITSTCTENVESDETVSFATVTDMR